ACSCAYNLSDSIPHELYQEVDFIAYVQVVDESPAKNIGSSQIDNGALSGHVALRIDSVFKGNYSKGQVIFTNQTGSGNCMKLFKHGERILILGYEIKKMEKIELSMDDKYPPPPLYDRSKNGIFKSSVFGAIELNYWNKLIQESIVIQTNQCIGGGK